MINLPLKNMNLSYFPPVAENKRSNKTCKMFFSHLNEQYFHFYWLVHCIKRQAKEFEIFRLIDKLGLKHSKSWCLFPKLIKAPIIPPFLFFLFYLKAKSGMYLKWVEADKLLAHDEFNECNVPHGSPRSTPAACLHNQSLRAAHFLRRGR